MSSTDIAGKLLSFSPEWCCWLLRMIGIWKVDQLLWHSNSGMATHRRDCFSWQGVFIIDTMVAWFTFEQENLYLRGKFWAHTSGLWYSFAFFLAYEQFIGCRVLGEICIACLWQYRFCSLQLLYLDEPYQTCCTMYFLLYNQAWYLWFAECHHWQCKSSLDSLNND